MRSSYLCDFLPGFLLSIVMLSYTAVATRQSGFGVYLFTNTGCDSLTRELSPHNDIALNQDYPVSTPFQSFEVDPTLAPGMVIDIKAADCIEIVESFDSSTHGEVCQDLPVTARCFRLNAPLGLKGSGIDVEA